MGRSSISQPALEILIDSPLSRPWIDNYRTVCKSEENDDHLREAEAITNVSMSPVLGREMVSATCFAGSFACRPATGNRQVDLIVVLSGSIRLRRSRKIVRRSSIRHPIIAQYGPQPCHGARDRAASSGGTLLSVRRLALIAAEELFSIPSSLAASRARNQLRTKDYAVQGVRLLSRSRYAPGRYRTGFRTPPRAIAPTDLGKNMIESLGRDRTRCGAPMGRWALHHE